MNLGAAWHPQPKKVVNATMSTGSKLLRSGVCGPVSCVIDETEGNTAMNTSTKIRLGIAAGLAVMAVIWILQNGSTVSTKFLFFTVTMPQSALLAITLFAGIAAGILLAWSLSGKFKKRKEKPPTA